MKKMDIHSHKKSLLILSWGTKSVSHQHSQWKILKKFVFFLISFVNIWLSGYNNGLHLFPLCFYRWWVFLTYFIYFVTLLDLCIVHELHFVFQLVHHDVTSFAGCNKSLLCSALTLARCYNVWCLKNTNLATQLHILHNFALSHTQKMKLNTLKNRWWRMVLILASKASS